MDLEIIGTCRQFPAQFFLGLSRSAQIDKNPRSLQMYAHPIFKYLRISS